MFAGCYLFWGDLALLTIGVKEHDGMFSQDLLILLFFCCC